MGHRPEINNGEGYFEQELNKNSTSDMNIIIDVGGQN